MTLMTWDNDIPITADANGFWTFSPQEKHSLLETVPEQDTWTLRVYRTRHCWAFDMPEYGVKAEALIMGTEKVLDYYWTELTGQLPSVGDEMDMRISRTDSSEYDTKIVWLEEDSVMDDSNNYLDVYSLQKVWLCPFLKVLFKGVPELIYVCLDPVLNSTSHPSNYVVVPSTIRELDRPPSSDEAA